MSTTQGATAKAGATRNAKHRGTRTVRTIAGVGGALAGAALVIGSAPATATAATTTPGTVHASGGLKEHTVPSTHGAGMGKAANNSHVNIGCQIKGTHVGGNANWYQLTSKDGKSMLGFVSAKYVQVSGKQPKFCTPGTSTSIKAKKSTHAFQGPSHKDTKTQSIKKGAGMEAWCYTYTHVPGANKPDKDWVAGVESGWIPREDVKGAENLPYCSHGNVRA